MAQGSRRTCERRYLRSCSLRLAARASPRECWSTGSERTGPRSVSVNTDVVAEAGSSFPEDFSLFFDPKEWIGEEGELPDLIQDSESEGEQDFPPPGGEREHDDFLEMNFSDRLIKEEFWDAFELRWHSCRAKPTPAQSQYWIDRLSGAGQIETGTANGCFLQVA